RGLGGGRAEEGDAHALTLEQRAELRHAYGVGAPLAVAPKPQIKDQREQKADHNEQSCIFSQEGAEERNVLGLGMGSEAGVGGWVVTAIHVAPVEIDSDRGPTTSVPRPIFRPSSVPSPVS